jgi:hypothetical protein
MPLQRKVNRLEKKKANIFNMRISTTKTKTVAFERKPGIRCKNNNMKR